MERSLPTPPREDHGRHHGSKKPHFSSKISKNTNRASKRASIHSHPPSPHDNHVLGDGRHKRVWKACERCRMKKTKCDGEFPCKRCKDDGLVCTAGTRKKTEYKQLPKGYAEVLENTQFALIATVHRLYSMVRNGQQWELGEPELNDRGQPVIHDIATRLGTIRPNSDIDLPVHSAFPEDEADLAELAAQLEAQQHELEAQAPHVKAESDSSCNRTDSSSEMDPAEFDDYRRAAFGGRGSVANLSPQSLTYTDFEVGSTPSDGFAVPSPHAYPAWLDRLDAQPPAPFLATGGPAVVPSYMNVDLLNQGLLESNFGALKPHVLSCPNPEVMMGVGDPMMFSGYDTESLRM